MEDVEKADVKSVFAVATEQVKEQMGEDTDFSEGSPGRALRDKISEGIKRSQAQKSKDDLQKARLGTVLDEVFKSLEDLFRD